MGSSTRNSTRARRARSVKPSQHEPPELPAECAAIFVNLSDALTGVSKAAGSGDLLQLQRAVRHLRNACIGAEVILQKAVRS